MLLPEGRRDRTSSNAAPLLRAGDESVPVDDDILIPAVFKPAAATTTGTYSLSEQDLRIVAFANSFLTTIQISIGKSSDLYHDSVQYA